MKIRLGYVSNSSSSSFCIVGVIFDSDKFNKQLDDVYMLANNVDLDIQNGLSNYYGESIIGKHIEKLKDEQTLRNFKDEIFEKLQQIGFTGNKEEIQILLDGGYYG